MSAGFDPYHKLLGIPPEEQPPDYYRLLGLSRKFEDDIEVIENCSNRVMQSLRQYQSGPHGPEIAKLLNEVSTARRTLLNPEKKAAYDEELRGVETDDQAVPVLPLNLGDEPIGSLKQKRKVLIPVGVLLVLLAGAWGVYATLLRPAKVDETVAEQSPELESTESHSNTSNPAEQTVKMGENPGDGATSVKTAKNESQDNQDSGNSSRSSDNGSDSASDPGSKTKGGGIRPQRIRIRRPAIELASLPRGQTSENLLASIDPEKDGSPGSWTKEGPVLASTSAAAAAVLVLPFEPVPTAMMFDLAIERVGEGPGEVFIQIPTSVGPAVYGIDVGSPQHTGVYIDSDKLEHAPHVQATPFFQNGVVNTFQLACSGIALRILRVEPSAENRLAYSWGGDFRRLVSGPAELPSIPKRVVIMTRGAKFKIHSLTYRTTDESTLPDPPATINGSDLISVINQNRDAQRGDWGYAANPIVAPATPYARLQVPIVVPEEYDVSVSVEISDDKGEFVLGLPVPGAVLRCFINPQQSDLPGMGIQPFTNDVFPVGEPVQFDFQVRKDSIRILKAGKVLRKQEFGALSRLKPDEFTLPWLTAYEQRRIFFGSNGSSYKIHGIGLAANSETQLASTIIPPREGSGFKRPVGSLVAGGDESAVDGPERAKEPGQSAQVSALSLVKTQFKVEFQKAKKPAEKLALAERLKTTADGEPSESATRFVLLEQVAELSVAAGEPQLALDTIDELGSTFQCDVVKKKVEVLKSVASKMPKDPDKIRVLFESAFSLAQQAADAEKYTWAKELYGIVSTKAKIRPVVDEANELKLEMVEREKLFYKVEAARKALKANPIDADAQFVIGEYDCLVRHDWNAGLLALQQGSNAELKALAERDLAKPQSAVDVGKLAQDWLTYAASDSKHANAGYADRAVYWLTIAAAEAQGLQQTKLQGLLQQAVSIRDWDQPYIQLLEKLAKSIEQKRFVKTPTIGTSLSRVVTFDELPNDPGLLVGLELKLTPTTITTNGQQRNLEQIDIVRGLFLTAQGTRFAEGSKVDADPDSDGGENNSVEVGGRGGATRLVQLRARRGYALAGVRMETAGSIYRLVVLFRKITPKGLDPDRSYWSETIGSGSPAGRSAKFQESPDTRNLPIVGITGDRTRTGTNRRISQIGFITVVTP